MTTYTRCDYCDQPLTEDGLTSKGKLIVSAKTCRNPECPMLDWTLHPDAHRAKCQHEKRGAA